MFIHVRQIGQTRVNLAKWAHVSIRRTRLRNVRDHVEQHTLVGDAQRKLSFPNRRNFSYLSLWPKTKVEVGGGGEDAGRSKLPPSHRSNCLNPAP